MKDSELLKLAKERILLGRNRYICDAINAIVETFDHQYYSLRKWIDEMINHEFSFEEWAKKNHPTIYIANGDVMKGRLAWLDWMIAYCEKEEAEQAK